MATVDYVTPSMASIITLPMQFQMDWLPPCCYQSFTTMESLAKAMPNLADPMFLFTRLIIKLKTWSKRKWVRKSNAAR